VSLEQGIAAPPVAPVPQEEARLREEGSRQVGLLIVVLGAILLTLAAGDALADVVLGGGDGDVLRGTDQG
jgi:hypothetical protein